MLLVYTAGPYRAKTEWELIQNIRKGEDLAAACWALGCAVISPHKNTSHFGGVLGLPDSTWLEGDLEMISRCDALVVVKDWERSTGTRDEINFAIEHGIPVFFMPKDFRKFKKWVEKYNG